VYIKLRPVESNYIPIAGIAQFHTKSVKYVKCCPKFSRRVRAF